jgi:hypothetical protein
MTHFTNIFIETWANCGANYLWWQKSKKPVYARQASCLHAWKKRQHVTYRYMYEYDHRTLYTFLFVHNMELKHMKFLYLSACNSWKSVPCCNLSSHFCCSTISQQSTVPVHSSLTLHYTFISHIQVPAQPSSTLTLNSFFSSVHYSYLTFLYILSLSSIKD